MKENHFLRYQLNKKMTKLVEQKKSSLYSGQMSSALKVFKDGQFLKLYSSENEVIGYGIYSQDQKVAIRVFHFGKTIRNRFFYKRLREVLEKRIKLASSLNSLNLINGDLDGFPGIRVDFYLDTAIISFLDKSLYKLARLISLLLPNSTENIKIKNILIRPKVISQGLIDIKKRVTRGKLSKELIINELGINYLLDLENSQNIGFNLDLFPLRQYVNDLDLKNKKVLNLFSGAGTYSLIALKNKADYVLSIETKKPIYNLFLKNIQINNLDHQPLLLSDLNSFFKQGDLKTKFDLIIIDFPKFNNKPSLLNKNLAEIYELTSKSLNYLNQDGIFIINFNNFDFLKNALIKTIGLASKEIFGKGKTKLVYETNNSFIFSNNG